MAGMLLTIYLSHLVPPVGSKKAISKRTIFNQSPITAKNLTLTFLTHLELSMRQMVLIPPLTDTEITLVLPTPRCICPPL